MNTCPVDRNVWSVTGRPTAAILNIAPQKPLAPVTSEQKGECHQ